jgi:NADPH2:quinone reductase
MRAAFIKQTGPAEVIQIGELPDPVPKEGEVIVRVAASAVNPIDLYIRSGAVAMPLPMPFIPHADQAGEVMRVGPGASRFKAGDRVWGSNQGMLGRQGTCAELAAVHEDWLYPLSSGVGMAEAAGAALTGITAHLGLFRTGRLKAGETVFVHGGTGGVGSMVVQMAKAGQAKVITTAGSEEKAKLCRGWGADAVLNYKTDNIAARIKEFTGGQGVDVWFETQREPDLEQILSLVRMRGRVVVIAGRAARPALPFGLFYPRDISILGFAMFNAPAAAQRVCAEEMNEWMASGELRAVIGKRFGLEQTAQAHRFLEENTIRGAGMLVGKVVVEV